MLIQPRARIRAWPRRHADHAAAANWFRKAADSGARRRSMSVGVLYENGVGGPSGLCERL